jgi:hypothetical protein
MKTQIQFQFKIFAIILALSFSVSYGNAQENTTSGKYNGGIGYFQTGYSFFNQSKLNDILKASGMPELENGSLSFGGGGHFIYKNFIIGGEGHGLRGNSSVNDQYRLNQSGGYGFFNFGYLVYQRSFITLYPIIGVGGGGFSVTITDKTGLPGNFNDLLADPKHESTISKGGFMLNFSVGSDFFISGTGSDKASGGFIIGLRAGYLLELNKNNWSVADEELAGGPDAGISGPFIRLTFGGGGLSR